jgi:hypothetical protein
MTCHHASDDPLCSSYKSHVTAARKLVAKDDVRNGAKPDAENYVVIDAHAVGNHVVLKVQYPSCAKCSYEGIKILVYLNVALVEVIRWKRIDPHFAEPNELKGSTDAPSPAARFPASDVGWQDAIAYAKNKMRKVKGKK